MIRRLRSWLGRWLRRGGEDSGFTVIEISITMALSGLISVSILGMLASQSSAEREMTIYSQNQEDVRQALVAMQQDLRSAEPLTEVSNPLDLRYRVDLRVYEDVSDPNPVQVRWRVTASDELVRETLDQYDNVTATTYRLKGVVNQDLAMPLFAYYKADDVRYQLSAIGTTPFTVAYCTVRVHIDLRAAPNGGRAPVEVQSDVQLRNRLPGAEECPN